MKETTKIEIVEILKTSKRFVGISAIITYMDMFHPDIGWHNYHLTYKLMHLKECLREMEEDGTILSKHDVGNGPVEDDLEYHHIKMTDYYSLNDDGVLCLL